MYKLMIETLDSGSEGFTIESDLATESDGWDCWDDIWFLVSALGRNTDLVKRITLFSIGFYKLPHTINNLCFPLSNRKAKICDVGNSYRFNHIIFWVFRHFPIRGIC